MKSYISYNLFRSRKKFNPLNLFARNSNITYEEFELFLNNKNVESPGIEYFNRVKAKHIENTTTKEAEEEIILKDEEIKKDDLIKTKPVSKKRKKKAKKNEDN
tara:strand:- start:1694 stop:2002 length:309 start_codon:yes stop_codon:yes gene_type:complete